MYVHAYHPPTQFFRSIGSVCRSWSSPQSFASPSSFPDEDGWKLGRVVVGTLYYIHVGSHPYLHTTLGKLHTIDLDTPTHPYSDSHPLHAIQRQTNAALARQVHFAEGSRKGCQGRPFFTGMPMQPIGTQPTIGVCGRVCGLRKTS